MQDLQPISSEIRDEENAAALSPIVAQAQSANNESYMMDSDSVRSLCSMHPMQSVESRNLYV